MEIRIIKPTIINPAIIKRAAVYARVSVSKDENDAHSLEAQTGYYENLIVSNPDWELLKVYTDTGISGTRDNRPAFQRMLQDARGISLTFLSPNPFPDLPGIHLLFFPLLEN